MAGDAAAPLVAALRTNDLAAVRQLVEESPETVNAKGSAGRTPVHVAVALRRYDALEVMLSAGPVDLALTNDEPDFQTAVDLAEELGHAMIVRLLKAHGARTTGKRAYSPSGAGQNKVLTFAGQTITLTPEQQAASESNRRLIGVALFMIFVLGLDWKLTLGACYCYYKISGGDAAPSGFAQLKAAALPPPAAPASVPAPTADTVAAGPSAAWLKKRYKDAKAASEREPTNEALKAEYKRAKRDYKSGTAGK